MMMTKKFSRSLAVLAPLFMMCLSQAAHAEIDNLGVTAEEVQFIQDTAEGATTGATSEGSVYLAKIINRSNGAAIEIDCIEGAAQACSKFGFYRISGAKEAKPFATRSNLDFQGNDSEFKFIRASEWILNDYSNNNGTAVGLTCAFTLCTVPVLMFVIDAALIPYDGLELLISRATYKKAVKNLTRALNTGASIQVSDKQFNKILNLAQ